MVSTTASRFLPAFSTLMLIAAFTPHAASQAPAQPPRTAGLDAILVADTRKGPGGTDANLQDVEELLSKVRGFGNDVRVMVLQGDRVTPGGIVSAVRGLDPGRMRDRTLFFYYAGHGGTDPKKGHFLRTPWGDLARSVLLAEIRARTPKLSLVITDCCSTAATLKAAMPPAPIHPDRLTLENLFFQHAGVVDINASSCHPEKGIYQAAFYYPIGGIFTRSFISMFNPARRQFLETAPAEPGEREEAGHLRRFRQGRSVLRDSNKDGFVDWSEAREYLASSVPAAFEGFRAEVSMGGPLQMASPADLRLLESQVSQDPQVFGPLAVRSDRQALEAPAPLPAQAARRPRFGATFAERYERGGAYLEITNVEARSPATKVSIWKSSKMSKTRFSMSIGDSILWANGVRIRSLGDFARVLDSVPEGGELNIIGYDSSTAHQSNYEATALLDRYLE